MNNGDQNQEQPADTNLAPISCDAEKKKEEQQRRNEWLKEKMEFRRKQQIQFIMTQTNYDESEATQKLETCNNDVMKVVGEYLGIGAKKDENEKKNKKSEDIFGNTRHYGLGVAKLHDTTRTGKKNGRNKKSN